MVYANERNESCFQIAQMQVYQVAKVGNIGSPDKPGGIKHIAL